MDTVRLDAKSTLQKHTPETSYVSSSQGLAALKLLIYELGRDKQQIYCDHENQASRARTRDSHGEPCHVRTESEIGVSAQCLQYTDRQTDRNTNTGLGLPLTRNLAAPSGGLSRTGHPVPRRRFLNMSPNKRKYDSLRNGHFHLRQEKYTVSWWNVCGMKTKSLQEVARHVKETEEPH